MVAVYIQDVTQYMLQVLLERRNAEIIVFRTVLGLD